MPDPVMTAKSLLNEQEISNHRTKWENKSWWLHRHDSPQAEANCRSILVNMATTNSVTMTPEHKAAAQRMLTDFNVKPKAPETHEVSAAPKAPEEVSKDSESHGNGTTDNINTIAGVQTEEAPREPEVKPQEETASQAS